MQCSAVQYSTVQHITMQCNAMHCITYVALISRAQWRFTMFPGVVKQSITIDINQRLISIAISNRGSNSNQ